MTSVALIRDPARREAKDTVLSDTAVITLQEAMAREVLASEIAVSIGLEAPDQYDGTDNSPGQVTSLHTAYARDLLRSRFVQPRGDTTRRTRHTASCFRIAEVRSAQLVETRDLSSE